MSIKDMNTAIEFDPGYKAMMARSGADQRSAMLEPFADVIKKHKAEAKKKKAVQRRCRCCGAPVVMRPIRPDDIK